MLSTAEQLKKTQHTREGREGRGGLGKEDTEEKGWYCGAESRIERGPLGGGAWELYSNGASGWGP